MRGRGRRGGGEGATLHHRARIVGGLLVKRRHRRWCWFVVVVAVTLFVEGIVGARRGVEAPALASHECAQDVHPRLEILRVGGCDDVGSSAKSSQHLLLLLQKNKTHPEDTTSSPRSSRQTRFVRIQWWPRRRRRDCCYRHCSPHLNFRWRWRRSRRSSWRASRRARGWPSAERRAIWRSPARPFSRPDSTEGRAGRRRTCFRCC